MEINGPVFIGFILAPTIKAILLFFIFHQQEPKFKGFLSLNKAEWQSDTFYSPSLTRQKSGQVPYSSPFRQKAISKQHEKLSTNDEWEVSIFLTDLLK